MSTIAPQSGEVLWRRLLLSPARGSSVRAKSFFEAVATVAEQCADFFTAAFAVTSAFWADLQLRAGRATPYSEVQAGKAVLLIASLVVAMLAIDGAYQRGNSLLRIRETERILRASARTLAIMLLTAFFTEHPIPWAVLAMAMLLVPLSLTAEKQVMYFLLQRLHSHGRRVRNVVIYGAGTTGRRLFSVLIRSPKLGLNPVAIVDDDALLAGKEIHAYAYNRTRSAEVVGGPVTDGLVARLGAHLVIVAIPSLGTEKLDEVARASVTAGAEVAFTPRLSLHSDLVANYVDIDGVLISSLQTPARRAGYDQAKRIFDLGAAALLLAAFAPFWLLIVLLIRADSSGPAIFTQDRIGRNGQPFRIFKFRTMYPTAPRYAAHPNGRDDERVTPLGAWLRRTSLDELPQLLNVLRGEMSLVGPRPEMPFMVEKYEQRHWQRLQVIPGITGLWQLSADRAFPIHENVHYDLYYVRNRNFFMDVAILFHTLMFAMKGM